MSLDLTFEATVEGAATKTAPAPPARRRPWIARALVYLLMALIAVPFVFPVYWMISTALKTYGDVFENPPVFFPADPQWQNFVTPFVSSPFLQQFFNSVYIAAITTVGVLAVSSLAGYAFARITFRCSSCC
jgi:multiple sugar transport system permease protein